MSSPGEVPLSRIDRYILKLFVVYLLAGLAVFVTLFLVVNIMSFALANSDAGATALVEYYAYKTPSVIYQLLPVASLMATLFTLSSLNRTNELTALFSLGMGLGRIATPILGAVALISAGFFFLGDQVLPLLDQKANYVEYVKIKKRPGLYSTVKTDRIWYRSENVLFNIKTLDPLKARAEGLTLYYFDRDWNLSQLVTARSVNMRGNEWDLKNGLVTRFTAENSFPLTNTFDQKTVSMNEDLRDIQQTARTSDVMCVRELGHYIRHNKEAGLDTTRFEVDYHAKFGYAFAAFVMSLVGVPFSVGKARSGGTFLNLGVCLALAFGYWATYNSGLVLGQHGLVPPVVAAWGANVTAILLAWFSLIRLKR